MTDNRNWAVHIVSTLSVHTTVQVFGLQVELGLSIIGRKYYNYYYYYYYYYY